MSVNTDPKLIDEVLSRGTVDVLIKENLRKEMLSGKQLKIYLGTDPTGGDLHLGHAAIHRKLKDFQDLGHKVTLLVGDYTVLVGDHSDKDDQRIEINHQKIEENMKTYKEQFGRTLDLSKVDLVYNSSWLSKLSFNDVIELAKVFTLQQMAERDAFVKRVKAGKPVGFDELLYPLMQGYDAHALKTDIQIGGTDQLFNLQAGRKIMEYFNEKPQNIITMDFLVGSDGRKMGKSLKNYIPVNSSAKEKYFALMTIIDDIIIEYFILLTRIPMSEIAEMQKAMAENTVNPRDLKLKLAFEVTKFFHGEKEAISAQDAFKNEVQNKNTPDDIKEVKLSDLDKSDLDKSDLKTNALDKINILDTLVKLNLTSSKTEARKLIAQGAVMVGDTKMSNPTEEIKLTADLVIKVGKKGYVKLI